MFSDSPVLHTDHIYVDLYLYEQEHTQCVNHKHHGQQWSDNESLKPTVQTPDQPLDPLEPASALHSPAPSDTAEEGLVFRANNKLYNKLYC